MALLKVIPAFAGMTIFLTGPALAQSVVDLWGSVVAPPAPALSDVTVDPASTAFLVLDFNGTRDATKGPCNAQSKPRCIASIPVVAKMLGAARAAHVLVIYSKTKNASLADIDPALAPGPLDAVVTSGPDKFFGTNLYTQLSQHGISTLVITGTAAEGAVLQTATTAVLDMGLKVVIPVDGISSSSLYGEQYTLVQLMHAPGLAGHVILTQADKLTF